MRMRFRSRAEQPSVPSSATSTAADRFAADQGGATAIEFAMVAGPFLFLFFGIVSVGWYFFVLFSLENAVESAARVIRTGQAQTQTPNPMTVAEFKTLVCNKLPAFVNCNGTGNKVRVNVQNFSDYTLTSSAIPECKDSGGNLIPATSQTFSPGASNAVVLVIVCYEWELSSAFVNVPYWISPTKSKMGNGSTMVQAATTFTSEPYN